MLEITSLQVKSIMLFGTLILWDNFEQLRIFFLNLISFNIWVEFDLWSLEDVTCTYIRSYPLEITSWSLNLEAYFLWSMEKLTLWCMKKPLLESVMTVESIHFNYSTKHVRVRLWDTRQIPKIRFTFFTWYLRQLIRKF